MNMKFKSQGQVYDIHHFDFSNSTFSYNYNNNHNSETYKESFYVLLLSVETHLITDIIHHNHTYRR